MSHAYVLHLSLALLKTLCLKWRKQRLLFRLWRPTPRVLGHQFPDWWKVLRQLNLARVAKAPLFPWTKVCRPSPPPPQIMIKLQALSPWSTQNQRVLAQLRPSRQFLP